VEFKKTEGKNSSGGQKIVTSLQKKIRATPTTVSIIAEFLGLSSTTFYFPVYFLCLKIGWPHLSRNVRPATPTNPQPPYYIITSALVKGYF